MAYGDLPQNGIGDVSKFRFPRGIILNKNLAEVLPVDPADPGQIQEEIAHSWYNYPGGKTALHPYEGVTDPNYTGPKPPYQAARRKREGLLLAKERRAGRATPWKWVRWPRMLVGFASGRTEFKEVVTDALGPLKVPAGRRCSPRSDAPPRAAWKPGSPPTGYMDEFDQLIANLKTGDSATADTRIGARIPGSPNPRVTASRKLPAARSATGSRSRTQKIANYQIVVPSTWNASPRDAKGQHGAYESALLGTPMADPKRPLEILRTIHSFDPCLACASHVIGPNGEKLAEIIVR